MQQAEKCPRRWRVSTLLLQHNNTRPAPADEDAMVDDEYEAMNDDDKNIRRGHIKTEALSEAVLAVQISPPNFQRNWLA